MKEERPKKKRASQQSEFNHEGRKNSRMGGCTLAAQTEHDYFSRHLLMWPEKSGDSINNFPFAICIAQSHTQTVVRFLSHKFVHFVTFDDVTIIQSIYVDKGMHLLLVSVITGGGASSLKCKDCKVSFSTFKVMQE